MMRVGPDRWTLTPEPRPDARIRLLCFHHAGGGAFGFRPWVKELSPDIELVAVQLPGRENRIAETPLTSAEAVLDGLVPALVASLEPPYAIFGHSFGAVMGYLLALRVRRTGELPLPAHLFISAARPPRSGPPVAPEELPPLTDAALIKRLERLGGTPKAVLDDPRLLKTFLRPLRADFEVLERACVEDVAPLDAPFTVLRGRDDPSVSEAHVQAWRALSIQPVSERSFPGNHFFQHNEEALLLGVINKALS
jgi:medium-chain acyl-[acyl-carrier-protein] hydrolase